MQQVLCCGYCTDWDGVNGAEDAAMMCREDCGRTQGGKSSSTCDDIDGLINDETITGGMFPK
eukprot:scaffold22659_cov60-Cyclotella_meneghiniana.AAC.1